MGYYVYKHTSPSGKIYIGITQQRPTKRWGSGCNYDYNDHFYNAIRKYGWNNFKHEILFEDLSREDACEKEKELILFYDSANRDKGYNVSPGGQAQTEETKAKIKTAREINGIDKIESERMKKQWADPQYRERVLANMRGKVRSPESREKYRQAALRRGPLKPESVEKMREKLKGRTGEYSVGKRPVLQIAPITLGIVGRFWTAKEAALSVGASINGIATVCRKTGNETKASHGYFWCYEDEYTPDLFEEYRGIPFTEKGTLSRVVGGRTSFLGKHHTDEAKKKMSLVHSKPVLCVETQEIFSSIRQAAEKYGCDESAIGRCLRGKAKTSCGYHWQYVEI